MPKTKKYSLAYWVKKCMNAWSPEKDILAAVQEFAKTGEHSQIEFSGTPLELATALYVERFKRGTPWQGFFPTPASLAAWAADLLPLNRGAVVLDPGCGFGALSYAVQQRGAVPQMVECSSSVVAIAQAIWGEAQVHYRDFLDGFRPTEFDAAITNPPFGNVFGHSDAAGDFLERIADLSRAGTYVAAILPRGYLAAERSKRRVEIAQRFTIIEKHDLNNDLFAPLTHIATTLYLLTVRGDGRLIGEVQPRVVAHPEPPPNEAQPIMTTSPVSVETAQPEPKFYPVVRGAETYVVVAQTPAEVDEEVQRGALLLDPTGYGSRAEAVTRLDQWRAEVLQPFSAQPGTAVLQDVGWDEAGNCRQCGEGGRCQCPHDRTAQSFLIELDGELIRAEYKSDSAIGRDVCFDFHGPTISATGYLTRFVARDTTLTLYEQAKAEAALAVAAWQQRRAKNVKTWPVKYAGDVAVLVSDQVVRGYPISWNAHDETWHVWLRSGSAITLNKASVLGGWVRYFAHHLKAGERIVYQSYPDKQRHDADFVQVMPGEDWEEADDGYVRVKCHSDGKVALTRMSDLIGLWDELSPAERGEAFEVPTFELANTHPLQMAHEVFAQWVATIAQTSQDNSKSTHWPLLDDGYLPRAWLPEVLETYLRSAQRCVLQHSTSTAYEAWGNDHLIIMQPKGADDLPWTVCYAAQSPSANSAGQYNPLPLTPIACDGEASHVQGTTLFAALNALRDHLCAWQIDVNPTLSFRGTGWTSSALQELLAIVERGTRVLVADDQLGLPMIHQIPNSEHMGLGTFRSVTEAYTVNWDAGGSMNRLSNAQGWTDVVIERGEFPYDSAKVVQQLQGWIAEVAQAPRFVLTTFQVVTTQIEREFTEAAQSAQGKEPWQMTRVEFQATQRPISDGAQGRMLLDLILAHGRDIAAQSDNAHISAGIKQKAIMWLDELRETLIELALAEHKPVPPEVLADYPDLAAQTAAPASEAAAMAATEPAPVPTLDLPEMAPPVQKPEKSHKKVKNPRVSPKACNPATTPTVDIPAHWRNAANFEFDLDGAPVIVEYDGANSIGYAHGSVHYSFHGPTISSTGYRSFFGNAGEFLQFANPEMYAISVAHQLASEKAKGARQNRKTWPFSPPEIMQVLVKGTQQAAQAISWSDVNKRWYVWLIDARDACSIKCEDIVGFDPSWMQSANKLVTKSSAKKTVRSAPRPTEYLVEQASEHDRVEVFGWSSRRWELQVSFDDRAGAIEWLVGSGIDLAKVHGLTVDERATVRSPFDLEPAAFDAWVQTNDTRHATLWQEAYAYFTQHLALSVAGWKYFQNVPLFAAKRRSIDPQIAGNPFNAPRDQFVQWVQANVDGFAKQAAYLQGYAAISARDDMVLLPEARAYLATQLLYGEAWAACGGLSLGAAETAPAQPSPATRAPVTEKTSDQAESRARRKRPASLPADIPDTIEVDVGGRKPLWVSAEIVRVSGLGDALKMIVRRSDGGAEVKLPIYARNILWRVPAAV